MLQRNKPPYPEYLAGFFLDLYSNTTQIDGIIYSSMVNANGNRLSINLTDSNCLLGDGEWKFDAGVTVTSLKVSGIEVINDVVLSNGNTSNSVVTPNIGLKLYDLLINDTLHYSCAEDGVVMQDDEGDNDLTVTGSTANTSRSTQDAYHWNAFIGIWRSRIDDSFSTYKVNSDYVRFHGLKETGMLPIHIESMVVFPNMTEIIEANIDPNQKFEVFELQHLLPSSFAEVKDGRIGNILVYNKIIPGQFPCYKMFVGSVISFSSMTNWNSIEYKGSGDFVLYVGANEVECVTEGIIYELNALDINGVLIAKFVFVEEGSNEIKDVINSIIIGTLPDSSKWESQPFSDYYGVYGGAKSKAFDFKSNTLTSVINNPTNGAGNANLTFNTDGDARFKIQGLEIDALDNLVNDPEGYPQGWGVIDGDLVFNAYKNTNNPDVDLYSTQFIVIYNREFSATDINLEIETKLKSDPSNSQAHIYALSSYDSSNLLAFKDAMNAISPGSVDNITSAKEWFNCLNGGEDQGGDCPNGILDTYPNSLGIPMLSSEIRSVLNSVFVEYPIANAGVFLDSYKTDGWNASDTGVSTTGWYSSLAKLVYLDIPQTIGVSSIKISADNVLATRSSGNSVNSPGGITFYSNYERKLQRYETITLLCTIPSANTEFWFRMRKYTIKEPNRKEGGVFKGNLKRSDQTVEGGPIENYEEMREKSDLAFKAKSITKS